MVEPTVTAVPGRQPFETFVSERSPRLLQLAWLICRDQEDARDAVQDALVALYPRWSRLPEGDGFEAYLYRTVVNACLRVIRRRPRALLVADPERLRSTPAAPDAGDEVSTADEVWTLCGELPPSQRAAVVLRFQRDLSFAEIARILGCREATARSHVHRATATLRSRLEARA
ncbi:MAG TPA: sigma-70 family RNA polymerase sigma factor [Propionibacteriaceae bacterium]